MEKATIQVLLDGDRVGEAITVMFNPAEYTLDKSDQFQSTSILGLSTPLTQFVSGNAETLALDLFFDTYEKGEDVRTHTKKILSLLAIDKELHAPPRCKFVWGKFNFKATVEKITQKFTLFLPDGTPVRATLNVTFKEYKTLSEQIGDPPRFSADRSKMRIAKEGDSLWQIANEAYGDSAEWRRIALANGLDDPRAIVAGLELRIPPIE